MSIFPGGGSPRPPPPRPVPPPPPPPPPPIPPEPEGKIVDKSDIARRAGRRGATLSKISAGGLGIINRPGASSDDKLG